MCLHSPSCLLRFLVIAWAFATLASVAIPRRTRHRTVDELFAAAYLRCARYVDPETHARGTVFDVIRWLARQRRMAGLM